MDDIVQRLREAYERWMSDARFYDDTLRECGITGNNSMALAASNCAIVCRNHAGTIKSILSSIPGATDGL